MPSMIKSYKPDRTVLDERPAFTALARPAFHPGSNVGCIVLHGIGGTPANMRVITEALAGEGYTVFAPLLPGHGETVRDQMRSTGKEWLSAVEDAYVRLKSEGCTQIFVLGLSLGGILSGLLAEARTVSGLCMICAPVIMHRFLNNTRRISPFVPVVRYMGKKTDDPDAQMYDGFATGKLRDLNRLRKRLIRNLAAIRCPILIMQAAEDNKVDPRSAEVVCKCAVNAPSIDFYRLDHSPHGCTYGPERDLVAQLAVRFVQNAVDSRPPQPL